MEEAKTQQPREERMRPIDEQKFDRMRFIADKTVSNGNTTRVIAVAGRSFGSSASPINGERLIFKLNDLKNFLWERSALVIDFFIGKQDKTALTADKSIPPAFIVGRLIKNIIIRFNQNSEEFYRSSTNDYYAEYFTRMITHYTHRELETHQNILGPIIKDTDEYARSNQNIDAHPTLKLRGALHLGTDHKKFYIPLNDIAPRIMAGVLNNVYEIEIEIQLLSPNTIICPVIADAGAPVEANQGRAFITECSLMRYDYYNTETPLYANVSRISFLTTDVYKMGIPTSTEPNIVREFSISGVQNLQSVLMFQTAAGLPISDAAAAPTYACPEQMLLFGTISTAAINLRLSHDQTLTVDQRFGLTYLQMFYGTECIPNTNFPFITSTTDSYDVGSKSNLEMWYYHALNAKGRLSDEERTLAIEKNTFMRTQPYIHLAFGTPGYPRLSSEKKLRILYSGVFKESVVNVVLIRMRGMEIPEGGAIKHLF